MATNYLALHPVKLYMRIMVAMVTLFERVVGIRMLETVEQSWRLRNEGEFVWIE